MNNNFYTYAYLREDGTPYYIGKGKGRRAYKKSRNDIKPPKDKSRIIFLKQNLTEEEAFKHEIYMIAVFGRKDLGTGILRNRTNGGEGGSGCIKTKEQKEEISKRFKGVPQDKEFVERRAESVRSHYNSKDGEKTKELLRKKRKEYFSTEDGKEFLKKSSQRWSGENNPAHGGKFSGEKNGMYGKKHTEETKRKIRKKCKGKNSKTYVFYNPNGEKVIIHNLSQFCKDNNFPQSVMASVATGKRKHHRGWTTDENFHYIKPEYIVIDPNGIEYEVENLTKFCREYDLSYSAMTNILYGKTKIHKGGWMVKYK